jgi:hypothetical protein
MRHLVKVALSAMQEARPIEIKKTKISLFMLYPQLNLLILSMIFSGSSSSFSLLTSE